MKLFDAEITNAGLVSIILIYPDSSRGSESALPAVLLPSYSFCFFLDER
jgi:hypothetical protein